MKSTFYYIFIFLLIFPGCKKEAPTQPSVIMINDIIFTQEEFEDAYQRSQYAKQNTPESRKIFLDRYISTKLILLAAEEQGLDKDPRFLKDVEQFWQQSLLKLMIDQKTREVSKGQKVSEKEMRAFYASMREEHFKDKPFEEVQETIKAILLRQKQQSAMESWVADLKQKAAIKVDDKLFITE